MGEDLTKKLPNSDNFKLILTAVQNLDTHVRSSLDQLLSWVSSIDSRLKHLEEKVDQRLHDTRPIWQKVVTDIAQLQEGQAKLQEGQQRLEEGQQSLQGDMREIRTSQRDAFRRMSLLNETLFAMQTDYRDIYDRVRGVELTLNPPNSST